MLQSMTGFGKAETKFENTKITVEIRSVNGKNSDISLKTQIIPKDKEIETKQMISSALKRGNIDLFINTEYSQEDSTRKINTEAYLDYFNQFKSICTQMGAKVSDDTIIEMISRIPDVMDSKKKEINNDIWEILKSGIEKALIEIVKYRKYEGVKLEEDIRLRINKILEELSLVIEKDKERVDSIKSRLLSKISDSELIIDNNRFEQELIYYLEKLDITEECIRLSHHCNYFLETISTEQYPGKKLGFIAQEIGREINTLGSKANHAEIQTIVVKMKDELEKIKEQSLNIL